ncbi:MAG: RNA-binding cell elongation regulator Jag/EloR [Anaerolineae bacterium]|nr:protein jag [Anaerolineae bacterium]MDW8067674.1 RNA-binding cell elongation regulator Jag/EloR [Anaerolineae bacterium]
MSREGKIFFGETVEAAIAAGLTALRLPREAVEIEVLDEGSRGILGIGARMARVRLTPLVPAGAMGAPTPTPTLIPEAPESSAAEVARTILTDLLQRLGFSAEIRVRSAEPATDEEEAPLVLDVQTPGADTLIGPRGETLAALQHILRLLVNRRMGRMVNLVVDVQGYKGRREQNLRRLAERMASQAVRSGRTVYLEPMPPYERRIIHLALRDHPDVTTQSVGEGSRRRVTIIPRVGKE